MDVPEEQSECEHGERHEHDAHADPIVIVRQVPADLAGVRVDVRWRWCHRDGGQGEDGEGGTTRRRDPVKGCIGHVTAPFGSGLGDGRGSQREHGLKSTSSVSASSKLT